MKLWHILLIVFVFLLLTGQLESILSGIFGKRVLKQGHQAQPGTLQTTTASD